MSESSQSECPQSTSPAESSVEPFDYTFSPKFRELKTIIIYYVEGRSCFKQRPMEEELGGKENMAVAVREVTEEPPAAEAPPPARDTCCICQAPDLPLGTLADQDGELTHFDRIKMTFPDLVRAARCMSSSAD